MKHPSKLEFKKPFDKRLKGGYRRATWKIPADAAGCYVIKDYEEIVYIGRSLTCLPKTAYRHFQTWNCRRQYRVIYAVDIESERYTMAVIICNQYQAVRYEDRWITKLQPRDNRMKIEMFERERRLREDYMKTLKSLKIKIKLKKSKHEKLHLTRKAESKKTACIF